MYATVQLSDKIMYVHGITGMVLVTNFPVCNNHRQLVNFFSGYCFRNLVL